jgi:hypothetical protein
VRVHHDYPYRLRIVHGDGAEIRLERAGRTLVVDPHGPVGDHEVAVLLGHTPERLRALAGAVRGGSRPTVVASARVGEWLRGLGPVTLSPPEVDGVVIELWPYVPAPAARPLGHFLQASIRAVRPRAALRRVTEAAALPDLAPQVASFTFPDGSRLLHLDLALHRGTSPAWLADTAARAGNAEWTLVGLPWGEADAVAAQLPRVGPNRVLVAELANHARRELGLPTELVTPLRDRLVAAGVEAHVLATQTSFRFE